MRILFITTEFPWPMFGGGRQRTCSQLRTLVSLASVSRVTVLGFSDAPEPTHGLQTWLGAKARVAPPIVHPIHVWDNPFAVPRVVALRARGVPYLVAKWDSRVMRAMFREQVREHDLVYFDHLGTTAYLEDVGDQRIVIEEHNIEHQILERFAEHSGALLGGLARLEGRRTRAYEARALRRAHCVISISERDKRACAALSDKPVHLVPMSMEQRLVARAPTVDVGYIGSLRWHPNKLGISWFCEHVWPLVRATLPRASFEIAGFGLADAPAAWHKPGIRFSGFLPDADAIYARARVMVAPVRGGSGLSVKVLDALAAGAAVVTTSDGVAGLAANGVSQDARVGDSLLVADAPGQFAAHIVRLLGDEAARAKLTRAGARFISVQHSPQRSAVALQAALASALQPSPLR